MLNQQCLGSDGTRELNSGRVINLRRQKTDTRLTASFPGQPGKPAPEMLNQSGL